MAWALAPENTLAAFGRATALGLTYLETDVHTTRDGHVVCFHDSDLRRVTGHPGRVADLDLADLRRAAGARHRADPDAGRGDGDVRAGEVRHRPQGRGVDRLDGPAAEANPRWAERVLVAGAWSRWLSRLQDEAPGVTTALGWRSLTTLIACSKGRVRPPGLGSAGGAFAHVPMRLGRLPIHSERVIARAHDLGIRVVVWTVDDPGTMRTLLDAGVDGIITDRPDVLREVLVSRGEWTRPDVRPPGGPRPALRG